MPGIFASALQFYRFMLISVSSISSETVMIFELPWKPRWVMIMSVNSLTMPAFAKSLFAMQTVEINAQKEFA